MNHIYRSVWSEALATWIAVAENTVSKGKSTSVRNVVSAVGLMACASASWALPTGGQVVAGQVNVTASSATQMNISQGSQNAVVNWNGFSIATPETVNIQQPNVQAAILNRVVGADASVIQGHLNANGQVYLVNPNGVLFSNTAQVDVGGLVASTNNISNADFLSGNNHFTQDGAAGSVSNQGTIKVPTGGSVALIGEQVSNSGTITTPQGTTALAAGKTVDLDMKGNGLVEVKIPEAALNAQVKNSGAIMADGGRVVLSAQSANALADTVINQTGVIQAKSLASRNGEIILAGGDTGTVQVDGTLDVNGQASAGSINVTGQNINLASSSNLTAQALSSGTGGTISVIGDMKNGTVNVAGNLNASGGAKGGFIETSAAHVKIADSANVTTKAANGLNGTWLIDPVDFTIAVAGGDVTGTALSASLNGGNVTISSASGASGVNGDINVNDAVSWSANTLLTLNALNNINVYAPITATGTNAAVSMNMGGKDNFVFSNGGSLTLSGVSAGLTINGTAYTLIHDVNQLQAMNGTLSGNFALGNNINASATSGWNFNSIRGVFEGFLPVGELANHFTGSFDGLGHTVSGLYIDSRGSNSGLFGMTGSAAVIQNVGLVNGSVSGSYGAGMLVGSNFGTVINSYSTGNVISNGEGAYAGGLVGYNYGSIKNSYSSASVNGTGAGGLVGQNDGSTSNISNSYATGSVQASNYFGGGLVGNNYGSISNSYATGNVTSNGSGVGGLVGINKTQGMITDAYATGNVTRGGYSFGLDFVGGLVGKNDGSIANTYAVGKVTGAPPLSAFYGSVTGGLVGDNTNGTISNSFWNMQTANQTIGVGKGSNAGVTGLPTASMMQMATFSAAGWNISNTGGSSAIWRIYEGSTYPLLRSFLTPLTIYSDGTYSLASVDTAHLFGSGTNTYSDQQGYDISFVTVIPPVVPPEEPPVIPPNLGEEVTPIETMSPRIPPQDREIEDFKAAPVDDTTEIFVNNPDFELPCNSGTEDCEKRVVFEPKLKVKNTAGRVERLQMSANKRYLSLLMEDGSVRVWDFQRGLQRQIVPANKTQALTDISAVDDRGGFVSVSNKKGVVVQDIISALIDDRFGIHIPDVEYFVVSDDGSLVMMSTAKGEVFLWSNGLKQHSLNSEENEEVTDNSVVNNLPAAESEQDKKTSSLQKPNTNHFTPADSRQNKKLWQVSYRRGVIKSLAMSKDKHYGAILSREPGVYGLSTAEGKLKPLIDAVNIVDLSTGKTVKTLPNQGEHVVFMEFKDNDTLQIGLATGEVYDWSISTGRDKTVADFAENVVAVDTDAARNTFAFVLKDGTVRVGTDQKNLRLSIQNKNDPFKYAKLLEDGKRLLTVLASGDLALWDVESGKKLLRLFSMKDGWTVMDAYGRFDGSEDAIENFSWLANENDIPLDKFSENYYEPGLLSSLLQNQGFINENASMIVSGITLPPKLNLQLTAQQSKGEDVQLQLDIYDRGGGIDKIQVYQNGKLLNNDKVLVTQTDASDHRLLNLKITPNAGKNTVKVVATNGMGTEGSSSELSFDGKTKAYLPSLNVLTVGINQYSDPNLTLSYSVADANAMARAMKNNSKVAASKSLTDERASKVRILAELKELSRGAQHDQLVIYLAGHGVAVGKEWYFLPYETKLQPTLEKTVATGITATELGNIFKDSKIQHILLMVDSCYSGASTDAFSKLENGQRYFTRQLSRSLGITVVTAATKTQQAAELKSLGHGLFTYMMTQEMEKKSASPVTAHSIAASISKSLPLFSQKTVGFSQEPAVYTFGSDFVLTDSAKKTGQK